MCLSVGSAALTGQGSKMYLCGNGLQAQAMPALLAPALHPNFATWTSQQVAFVRHALCGITAARLGSLLEGWQTVRAIAAVVQW